MNTKLSKANQSVEKTMKLVEVMASHGEPIKLQTLSEKTEIPASTALRMINTLLQMGYVTQNPDTLRYSLSLKFAFIGEQAKQQVNITQIAHPHLTNLSNIVGECSCLAVEENGELLYLDVFSNQKNSILTTTQRIGKHAPLYCTGIGKLLLTNYSNDELKAYTENTPMVAFTPSTITTFSKLQERLAMITSQGYALDDEECDLGAKCVAAPIRDYTKQVVAGISVTAPALRLQAEKTEAILPVLLETAGEISKALGYWD